MWPGWVALGPGDPFVGDDYVELVNNQRTYQYAAKAGISWLLDCLDCPEAGLVMPGGPDFVSPTADPAPWYDPDNPDTWGFYGVVGLEVVGADASTRQVTITNTLQAGGVAGPPYYGPRTIVFRGMLVAQDECSLQAGLDWLRYACISNEDPCHGDALTFFDCCPCICDDEEPSGPCWATNYAELTAGPVCARLGPSTPPYWDGTIGSFIGPTTMNPGALPDICTFVYHVRGPTGEGPIAAQWETGANLRSWQIERDTSPAQMRLATSATGTSTSLTQTASDAASMTADQYLALSREVTGGQQKITSWVGSAGGAWGQMAVSTLATNVTPLDISGTRPLRIGHTMTTGAPAPDTHFAGRIYSVELRRGLDPSPDASNVTVVFPGTAGSYLSVPDHPALDVPADLEVTWRMDFPYSVTPLSIGKWGAAGQRSWRIRSTTGPVPGAIFFEYSFDGTTTVTPSPLVNPTLYHWYKITRAAIDGTITWYRATTDTVTEPGAGGWTTIATDTSTPGTLFNSTAPITLGGDATTANAGTLHRAIVRNVFGAGTELCAFSNVPSVRLAAAVDTALNIVGDIDIVLHANMGTTDANQHTFLSKAGGTNNRAFEVGYINSRWNFRCATAAVPGTMLTAQPNVAQTLSTHWFRVTRVAATGVISMYTAPTSSTEPTTWTPITGSPITQAAGNLVNSTATLDLGGRNSATTEPAHGRLLRAIVRNGIGGPIVFDFRETDPPNAAVDTFTCTSGQTMTVHRNGVNTCLYGTVLDVDDTLIATDTVTSFPAATGQTVTVHGDPLQEVPAEVLWRFDAADAYAATGAGGDEYTDPRGRDWLVPVSIAPPGLPELGEVWWPRTYAEQIAGPPVDDEDWCSWPRNYYDLTNGPPGWVCCVDECVVPYLRQFHNARITEGPIILRQPVMNTCGALAEIEVTVVAADPRKYTLPSAVLRTVTDPGEPHVEISSFAVEAPDPFVIPGVTASRMAVATRTLQRPAQATEWLRTTHESVPSPHGTVLWTSVPIVSLAAINGDVGEVRLGLWRAGHRVGGFWLPFIPGGSTVTIDGALRRVIARVNGSERVLSNFARDFDGGRLAWPELGHGAFELTVDQEAGRAGRLAVEVHAVDVGLS